MTASHPLLQFGAPPDGAAWAITLLGSILAAATAWPRGRARVWALLLAHPRLLLSALAVTAAALSAAYVQHYLRGGPRIIDATAYFLQGRALLDGGPSFEVPTPSAAFRGRFLVPTPGADPTTPSLGVLFPPGYPAVLAAGFALGHPLWLGPLLGAALVVATYGLALRLSGRVGVGLLAAALSVASAALRYHTADTMSHGLAALLFTVALWACLAPQAQRWPELRSACAPALLAGACAGWLTATRPVTGLVCAAACVWLLTRPRPSSPWAPGRALGRLALFGAASLPGLGLLLWQQLELSGHALGSVQLRYYSLADGPSGCFGLGLGSRFGCHYEHGDVVARFGDAGFSPLWALRHTLHRLHHHTLDLANWEPAWLLVPWALWQRRKNPDVRVLALAGLGVAVAYGAFYFPGNYPGGGARFFLELIPLEHAVVAWGSLGSWAGRWLLPVALLGFGCHGSYSHRDLAEREGGRPMFEPDVVSRALGEEHDGALLFVDTDHGFNLGFDPALARRLAARSTDPATAPNGDLLERGETLVARTTSPDLDRLLWERLGRPPAYEYQFHANPDRTSSVVPLLWSLPDPARLPSLPSASPRSPPHLRASRPAHLSAAGRDIGPLRAEAEHDWPLLSIRDGWGEPTHPPVPCTSGGRALTFHATGPGSSLAGELNVGTPGRHLIVLGFVALPRSPAVPPGARGRLLVAGQALTFDLPSNSRDLPWDARPEERAQQHTPCPTVELPALPLTATSHWTLETGGHSLTLDYIEVVPARSSAQGAAPMPQREMIGAPAPKPAGRSPL